MGLKENIKKFRQAKGYTLEDVSKKAGVNRQTIQKYESGVIANIPSDKIEAMAELFGVTPAVLMGWEEDVTTIPNIIPLPKTKTVPLLGTIACGEPILAVENIEKNIEMPENINADFALRCKGDSMINARIYDGDIVYIRQQPNVENGEIAAVLIDDEATLKRIKKTADKVMLWPENQNYEPLIYVGEEINNIRILGKAVAFTSAVK